MCVVSWVHDHYEKTIPQWPTIRNPGTDVFTWPPFDTEAMKKLIREFREAVEAAKKIDVLTGQPDCVDPNKAKLEERVASIEERLHEIERRMPDPPKPKRKRSKR